MKNRGKVNSTQLILVIVFMVIVYGIGILLSYNRYYVDVGQALRWYGTVRAAHFLALQPHFLGQRYGSMLNAYVAVPLYGE